MSLTAITGAKVYYLEGTEVHGDIATPVHGDLAIYTYVPTGGFIGQEYSYATTTGWFERTSIKQSSSGEPANQVLIGQLGATSGTLAEMATDALTLSASDEGKRWQATDDNDRIYVWSFAGGAWGYYPASGTNTSGDILVAFGSTQTISITNFGDSGATANIVAANPVVVSGLSIFGFPYETVIFTRTGSTGNVGLSWSVNSSGILLFQLSWSAGSDAVNITATLPDGSTLSNIPHNIGGVIASTAITANSTGTLYIG